MRGPDLRYELQRKLRAISEGPQTPSGEDGKVTLGIEIALIDAEREVKILRLQKLLWDAYKRSGSMSVIHPSGAQKTERPEYGGSAVQHIWNARSKSRELAEWATP